MKKLYLLLLATQITSCMEMQRIWASYYDEKTTECPPIIFGSNSPTQQTTYSIISDQNQPNQHPMYVATNSAYAPIVARTPVYCEANEPCWEIYHDIMYMTYEPNQPSQVIPVANAPIMITSTNDLTPVYHPIEQKKHRTARTKKEIKQSEIKTLLRTKTSVQPNTELMNKLYENAYTSVTRWVHRNPIQHKELIELICKMNHAKKNGINEDLMGKFSHQSYDPDRKAYTAIFFSCLKKYMLTIKATQEAIPRSNAIVDENLGKALNSQLATNSFPAYAYFMSTLHTLVNRKFDDVYKLSACLYSETNTLFEGSWEKIHDNPIDMTCDFYLEAYRLVNNYLYKNLHTTLIILENAKKSRLMRNEKDFGYNILEFEPTCTLTGKISSWWNNKYAATDTKNRISLLLHFIEKYNAARGAKITPSPAQDYNYKLHKLFDIAVPETFNKTLFDEQYYAFLELNELINNIETLVKADDLSVQNYVNEFYSQGNKL